MRGEIGYSPETLVVVIGNVQNVADACAAAGIDPTGRDIRVNGNYSDINTLLEDDFTILLLKRSIWP